MLSKQNKSFFLLLFLTVSSLYVALVLTREIGPVISKTTWFKNTDKNTLAQVKADADVNSSDWISYNNVKHPGFTFKYPRDWAVTTYASTDSSVGDIIKIQPNIEGADAIRIYLNKKGYVAFEGLKTTTTTVNNIPAITVNNMLYGIRVGKNYVTFDMGATGIILPYFHALLDTVELG